MFGCVFSGLLGWSRRYASHLPWTHPHNKDKVLWCPEHHKRACFCYVWVSILYRKPLRLNLASLKAAFVHIHEGISAKWIIFHSPVAIPSSCLLKITVVLCSKETWRRSLKRCLGICCWPKQWILRQMAFLPQTSSKERSLSRSGSRRNYSAIYQSFPKQDAFT